MNEQILWCEKYRPTTVEECILPESIKKTFKEFVEQKQIPNLLLSGSAGVGKTTIAKALCNEVGCDWIIINGSDENGIDVLRTKIKNYASAMSFSGGRKVVIIDEADYLNANSIQPALRGAIEEFSSNCSFIFTCNYKNRIIEPLHSRCAVIDFKINGQKKTMMNQMYKRILWILDKEKVTYDKEVVATLISKYFPDNRRIINELQRYSSSGNIDVGILNQVSDINIVNLIKALKEKNFSEAKQWVSNNIDNDPLRIYRKMYDGMYDILQPNSIPQVVMLIAKYQYQQAFAADAEINLMAFIVEMMVEAEFK